MATVEICAAAAGSSFLERVVPDQDAGDRDFTFLECRVCGGMTPTFVALASQTTERSPQTVLTARGDRARRDRRHYRSGDYGTDTRLRPVAARAWSENDRKNPPDRPRNAERIRSNARTMRHPS